MSRKCFANICAIIVFVFMLAASPIQAASAQDGAQPPAFYELNIDPQPVEVRLNPVNTNYKAAPPAPRSVRSAQSANMQAATFNIQYLANGQTNAFGDSCMTFPDQAKPPFEYAASIWAAQLNATIPTTIQACWATLGPGVLGHGGARSMYTSPGYPFTGDVYVAALANQYSGYDRNGAEPEIVIAYNNAFLNSFYYGTDFNTPANMINFATVVLHEIAHGLGFLGYMTYSGGTGSYAYVTPYDRYAVDGINRQLINTGVYPNPSAALGSALTSSSVYFNGANARTANGGTNARLYAPSSWAPGSSYAHLDWNTYSGTINRLMTYAVSYGESNYNPGPVTMGILTDIGWPYPPTDITLSNASVGGGLPVGTSVGTFSTTDPNTPEIFTYSLVGGSGSTDNGSFTISGSTLQTAIIFPAAGSKSIRVRSTDRNNLYTEKIFTITVTAPANQPPTDIALSPNSVAENQPANTTVGALTTTDPDAGNTFTYSLASTGPCPGTDNTSFNINGSSLRTSAPFNFESKSSYTICVRSTDQGGLYVDHPFTISVTNANEPPTDIALSPSSVAENQPVNATVGTLSAADPDAGATFTFSLASTGPCPGTDNASFNIYNNTTLRTSASFNFESKSSYAICVRVTDQGALAYDKSITITVTDVNEVPTTITLSASSIAENQPINTTVGALTTTDPDSGNTFTYSLVSTTPCPGTDNASFNINGSSLRSSASFNFEGKTSYTICIRTTDQGALSFDKAFTVSVTNVNEAPTNISLSSSSLAENQPANTVVGALSTTDPDAGSTFTYSLVSTGPCPGTDNASFNINGSDLRAGVSFDFESKSSYMVCVRTSDQGALAFDKAFTISVTNVNETPTNISLSASTIAENQPANSTIGALTSADPDAGNTFTYSLVSTTPCPGTDNASFNISSSSLRSSISFNFEAKASYTICIRTTDQGGLTFDTAFTITIDDANEAPTNISLNYTSIEENMPATSYIGKFTSTDPDADNTFTYALASTTACPGADNGAFTIEANWLKSAQMYNYEAKSSYAICVRSTDQDGLSFDKPMTITIDNVNEEATEIYLSAAEVETGAPAGTSVGTLSANDPDTGDTLTFSLSAGWSDNDAFTITGNVLSLNQPVTKTAGETYQIMVTVVDAGGLGASTTFLIDVVAVVEDDHPIYLPIILH